MGLNARLHAEVLVFRGAIAESRHRVQCAVADDAGRLQAANTFAAHDTSRFTGRVSCVPRASWMPLTTVSTGAV